MGASLLALDDQIGRIMNKMRVLGIENNTLVMFSSDNGGDPKAGCRSAPYRGGKGDSNMQWEGNYRMPTIFTFPGTLPSGKEFKGIASTLDFYATALAAAGTKLPKHCEGKNLLPLLINDNRISYSDEALFWHTHAVKAARWQQWRIVKYSKEKNWRLFDIEKDPSEENDLASIRSDVVMTLEKRYHAWFKQMPPRRSRIKPPESLLPYTHNGEHARHPFGRGWMTVEEWDKIKDDPTQWSEIHVRQKMLQSRR